MVLDFITYFKEDSDPIEDLGIGMSRIIKEWVENETDFDYTTDISKLLSICTYFEKIVFVKYLLTFKPTKEEKKSALQLALKRPLFEIIPLLIESETDDEKYEYEEILEIVHEIEKGICIDGIHHIYFLENNVNEKVDKLLKDIFNKR